jgi:cellulose synthase/poly-beta-1,6-N-acetylglucosamine synthase-like glycosyltransferase
MSLTTVAAPRLVAGQPAPAHVGARAEALPAIHDGHAFCITLYNEAAPMVRESLISLLVALRTARADTTSRAFHATICIIADGERALDPGCAKLFERCGLVHRRRSLAPAEMEIHTTTRPLDGLLQALGGAGGASPSPPAGNVEFVVCIKSGNAGKLHSHYVFFELLCPRLRPDLCYQIDVGTTLEPQFILALSRRMDSEPTIAAIAPCITPPIPGASCGFFEEWQYYDFAMRVAVHWPAEAASGFLSVIPGQACVFRWSALARAARGDPQRSPWISTPIDFYLRGMHTTKPLEKLMFLAEDRVLGAEVVLAPRSNWKLEYDSVAAATTDTCRSFRELRRQRRRWINSVLACRLALFARLASGNRSRTRRYPLIQGALIFVMQLMLAVREFIAPAFAVSYLMVTNPFTARTGVATTLFALFWGATLLHVGSGFLPSAFNDGRSASRLALFGRIGLGWSVAALHVIVFATQISLAASILALSPLVITLIAMALVLPRPALRIVPRMLFAPCSYLLATSVLLLRSFADFDNLSWGTKGLTATQDSKAPSTQLRRTRLWLLSSWALLNAALVYCSINFTGILMSDLNLVFEVNIALEALLTIAALIVVVRRRRALPPLAPAN